MKLIMESWRRFTEDEEEERSELDKLLEIFWNNGAQGYELASQILDDQQVVGRMGGAVKTMRWFLEKFNSPSPGFADREAESKTFKWRMNESLRHLPHSAGEDLEQIREFKKLRTEIVVFYQDLNEIIKPEDRARMVASIEAAAEWAGAPIPKIPEGPSK